MVRSSFPRLFQCLVQSDLAWKGFRSDLAQTILAHYPCAIGWIHLIQQDPKPKEDKKVLLRECKRHTARHVASARYAGGGISQVPPLCRPGMGYPPVQTWNGVPPPPARPWMGYPPPPPPRCWLTNKLKTVPSPILRIRAVKNTTVFSLAWY